MKPILFFISAGIFFLLFQLHAASEVGNIKIAPQEITINKGDTLIDVLGKLKIDKNDFGKWEFNKDSYSSILYRKFFAPKISLQVGTYKIETTSGLSEVLSRDLKKPIHTDATITFLPGWNLFDIEDYLLSKGIKDTNRILLQPKTYFPRLIEKYPYLGSFENLEGVLYPDTYRISQTATIDQVVEVAVKNFHEKIYLKLSDTSKKSFYKTLILASIVEKEERNSVEKPYIAGVLSKRIEIKMSLGADATVCYALSLGTSECTPADIVAGLSSNSPYNTRKFTGLPPSPISNVTRESWLAAEFPKYNGALYYLHDSDGNIYYGKTLEEHNSNKRKYLSK